MTVIKNDVKGIVSNILTGVLKYDANKHRSLILPPNVKKEWLLLCDAMEDPLYYKVHNEMTPEEKERLENAPWKDIDDSIFYQWMWHS